MKVTIPSSNLKFKLKEVEEVFTAVVEKVMEYNERAEVYNSRLLAGHEEMLISKKKTFLLDIERSLRSEPKRYGIFRKYSKFEIEQMVENESCVWDLHAPAQNLDLRKLWDIPSAERLLVLQNVVEYAQYVTLDEEDCKFIQRYSLENDEKLEDYLEKLDNQV